MTAKPKGLVERLQNGEDVVVAEGYLFEFERRGYLKAGAFVPEVVVEHPDHVRLLTEEFVHAGSDVVLAFTYYGHREKLRVIGREDILEKLNRQALRIARKVADDTGTLMAGNISNTSIYAPGNPKLEEKCREIFKEQVEWAVQEGADYIVAETYTDLGEAMLALDAIKAHGNGLPAVVTLMSNYPDKTYDGVPYPDALKQLEDAGAAAVGLNCCRGPDSILPVMKEIRKTCKGPLACLPVPYRTTTESPAFQDLVDQRTGKPSFPVDLDSWLCSRSHIEDFTRELKQIGVQYMGICCGNRAHYIRAMAEVLGRRPPASKYSPDMTQHLSELTDEEHAYTSSQWQHRFKSE